jgi:hypothetical protein
MTIFSIKSKHDTRPSKGLSITLKAKKGLKITRKSFPIAVLFGLIQSRVARWFIFKPNHQLWYIFEGK